MTEPWFADSSCKFCGLEDLEAPVRVDVGLERGELLACRACYEFLRGGLHARIVDDIGPECGVCFSEMDESAARYLVCDTCKQDIADGRRVLIEDGDSRTIPSEFREGRR